jgi:hypothetical protein
MGLVIDPTQYIVGAADVYYRPIGGTGLWISIGATVDDVVFRVTQSIFNPSENFNGLLEPVREMDYKSKASAEAEFSMPEFAGAKLALAIPGVVTTAGVTTAGDGSTTLAADAAAGATQIELTSAANFTAGSYVKIDITNVEYRKIDELTGTTAKFRDPLRFDHASGVAAVETLGDGKTELTPGDTRRLPLTAYNDFALIAQSPEDYYELYLYNAISKTESAEISFGNESMAAIKVSLGTRRDGANLSDPSWRLRVPA